MRRLTAREDSPSTGAGPQVVKGFPETNAKAPGLAGAFVIEDEYLHRRLIGTVRSARDRLNTGPHRSPVQKAPINLARLVSY